MGCPFFRGKVNFSSATVVYLCSALDMDADQGKAPWSMSAIVIKRKNDDENHNRNNTSAVDVHSRVRG